SLFRSMAGRKLTSRGVVCSRRARLLCGGTPSLGSRGSSFTRGHGILCSYDEWGREESNDRPYQHSATMAPSSDLNHGSLPNDDGQLLLFAAPDPARGPSYARSQRCDKTRWRPSL